MSIAVIITITIACYLVGLSHGMWIGVWSARKVTKELEKKRNG